MKDRIMLGLWKYMLSVPPYLLDMKKQLEKNKRRYEAAMGFMTEDHRAVHHFAVRELPKTGKPMPPGFIAAGLGLPKEKAVAILEDLEKHMTFLFRNKQGEVTWAYPVTVEKTPHHLTFSTGEQVYAAWAVDALATPFVQGRLRNEKIIVTVRTGCAHCKTPMEMIIDSDLNITMKDSEFKPLAFIPDVDLLKLKEESIINAFWKETVFFRSEEYAREHRRAIHRIRGVYLEPEKMKEGTKMIQSVLFGFEWGMLNIEY